MFHMFNRSKSVPSPMSSTRTRALVEGMEGRSMMSVSLSSASEISLLPAVQHSLLVPAVHPTTTAAGNAVQTSYLIGLL